MLLLYRRRRPLYDPTTRPLGDKLQRLALIAPKDLRAIELLVDDVLRHRWPTCVDPFGRGGPLKYDLPKKIHRPI